MKYFLPLVFLLMVACQGNQQQTKTSRDKSPDSQTTTKTKEKSPAANAVVKLNPPDTAYVTARSGLRVRQAPSLEGKRIGVRPYGKKVLITERSGISMSIQDEGKEVHAYASYWFLEYGNKNFTTIDQSACSPGRDRISTSSDLGLGDFVYVKNIKNNFAYLGHLCGQAIWINLAELEDSPAKYYYQGITYFLKGAFHLGAYF